MKAASLPATMAFNTLAAFEAAGNGRQSSQQTDPPSLQSSERLVRFQLVFWHSLSPSEKPSELFLRSQLGHWIWLRSSLIMSEALEMIHFVKHQETKLRLQEELDVSMANVLRAIEGIASFLYKMNHLYMGAIDNHAAVRYRTGCRTLKKRLFHQKDQVRIKKEELERQVTQQEKVREHLLTAYRRCGLLPPGERPPPYIMDHRTPESFFFASQCANFAQHLSEPHHAVLTQPITRPWPAMPPTPEATPPPAASPQRPHPRAALPQTQPGQQFYPPGHPFIHEPVPNRDSPAGLYNVPSAPCLPIEPKWAPKEQFGPPPFVPQPHSFGPAAPSFALPFLPGTPYPPPAYYDPYLAPPPSASPFQGFVPSNPEFYGPPPPCYSEQPLQQPEAPSMSAETSSQGPYEYIGYGIMSSTAMSRQTSSSNSAHDSVTGVAEPFGPNSEPDPVFLAPPPNTAVSSPVPKPAKVIRYVGNCAIVSSDMGKGAPPKRKTVRWQANSSQRPTTPTPNKPHPSDGEFAFQRGRLHMLVIGLQYESAQRYCGAIDDPWAYVPVNKTLGDTVVKRCRRHSFADDRDYGDERLRKLGCEMMRRLVVREDC